MGEKTTNSRRARERKKMKKLLKKLQESNREKLGGKEGLGGGQRHDVTKKKK